MRRFKPIPTLTSTQIADFWSKVAVPINNSKLCWVWEGGFMGSGFGIYSINKSGYLAHRISYVLTFGEPPDNTEIDHICHNPACIRPEHLEAVTKKTRNRDKYGYEDG